MPEAQQSTLRNILNGMEALVTVCDAENFQLFFLNDAIRAHFGIGDDYVGKPCHRVLQKLDSPCPTCPHEQLHREPDKTIVWEHRERVKGAVLRKTASLIDWDNGRRGHLEYAIDISKLRQAQDILESNNRLLSALNRASAIMLQSDNATLGADLPKVMGLIGEAADIDRMYIWKNYRQNDQIFRKPLFVWLRESASHQHSDAVDVSTAEPLGQHWEMTLAQGLSINGPASNLPVAEHTLLSGRGVVSILVVPIFTQGQFWGFVSFDDCYDERKFSANEEQFLRSASEALAATIIRHDMEKNISYLETEVDKIYYDPLTGIYNRRLLDESLKRLMPQLSRSGSMLSTMMIDIDFFKKYNDVYGHGAGDDCLKMVAETLRDCMQRKDDFVARYGGEEFVIVMPNTNEAGARRIANKLLEAVRSRNIPHEQNSPADCVTISLGVTSGRVRHTHSKDDFLKRADEMLYASKRDGRNRYSFSTLA